MDAILILFILAALGCIAYSLSLYRKTQSYQYRQAQSHHQLYLYETNQTIFVTARGSSFIGDCLWIGEEDHYFVKTIHLRLENDLFDYRQWNKNDFYQIEKKLYEKYPYAEIIWEAPMKEIMTI